MLCFEVLIIHKNNHNDVFRVLSIDNVKFVTLPSNHILPHE